jgi:peptide/nickel transport system permease protein
MAVADHAVNETAGPEPQPEPGARARARARRVLGSPSLRLAGRRLLAAILVLWGVTFLTYVVMNLLPGDAAQELLGANATPAEVHQLEVQLHLNEPFWVRYGQWLGDAFHGSLGTSVVNGENVTTILGTRLPVTVELLLYAFVGAIVFGVAVAVLASRRPNGVADRLGMMVSMTGLSIAPYVLALVLIYLFAVRLPWFPAIGYTSLTADPFQNIRSLTLPAVAIGFPLFSIYTRLLRADIVEQMQREDYIVTARAKGVPPWRVLLRHALPNSMFGLITLVALNLGTLVGAVAIIEPIFSLPGVGAILIQSINDHDVPVVEGIVVFFGAVVVVANLLADLLYTALDPRIRYERAAS